MRAQPFGEALAAARKQRGLSQRELGTLIGKADHQPVSHWERGLSHPSFEDLGKLATVFGVTLSELMDGVAPPATDESAA